MAADFDLVFTSTIQALVLSVVSSLAAQFITCYRHSPITLDTLKLARYVTYTLLSTPPNVCWQAWLEGTFPRFTSPEPSGTVARSPAVKDLADTATSVDNKVESTTTAIAQDETVQAIKRRATDGAGLVRAKTQAIKTRYGLNPTPRSFSLDVNDNKPPPDPASDDVDAVTDSTPTAADGRKLSLKNTAIKFALDQTFGAVINNLLYIVGINLLQGRSWDYIMTEIDHNFVHIMLTGQKIWPAVCIMQMTMVPLEYRTLVGGLVGIGWGTFLNLRL